MDEHRGSYIKRWSKRLSRLRGIRRGGSVVGLAGKKEWQEDKDSASFRDQGLLSFVPVSMSHLNHFADDLVTESILPGLELFEVVEHLGKEAQQSQNFCVGCTVASMKKMKGKGDKKVPKGKIAIYAGGDEDLSIVVDRNSLKAKPRKFWTMRDVASFFVQPALQPNEAFVDRIATADENAQGDAANSKTGEVCTGTFVICAESAVFSEVIDVLRKDAQRNDGNDNSFFWLRLFNENFDRNVAATEIQHMSLLQKHLPNAISRFDEILLVGMRDTLDDPLVIWQLYHVVQEKALLRIEFPESEGELDKKIANLLDAHLDLVDPDAQGPFHVNCFEMLQESVGELFDLLDAHIDEDVLGSYMTVDDAVARALFGWLAEAATVAVDRLKGQGASEEDLAHLLGKTGVLLLERCLHQRAVAFLEEASLLYAGVGGKATLVHAATAVQLGKALLECKDVDRARRTLHEAIELLDSVQGESESVESLLGQARMALGILLQRTGALDQAMKNLNSAMPLLNPNSPFCMHEKTQILIAIAGILAMKSKPEESLKVFDKELSRFTPESLQKDFPLFNQLLTQKAALLRAEGQPQKALSVLEAGYAKIKRHVGESHRSVSKVLISMGLALVEVDQFSEGLDQLDDALKFAFAVDPVHPDAITILEEMGRLLFEMGQQSLSLERLGAAEELASKHFGKGSLHLCDIHLLMGKVLISMGDLDRAEETLRRAYAVYKRNLGETNPEIAEVLTYLAQICVKKENHVKALEFWRSAHGVVRELYGDDDFRNAHALEGVFNALEVLGHQGEAKEVLVQITALSVASMKDSLELAAVLLIVGNAMVKLNEHEGIQHLQRAFDIFSDFRGSEHPLTLEARIHLETAKASF